MWILSSVVGLEVMNFYRHCGKDKGQYFPGRIIATLEERDGVWVRI